MSETFTGTLVTKDYKHFKIIYESETPPIEFEGATRAGRAFPGDTVQWDGANVVSFERSEPTKFLVGTLELAAKVRYGLTSRGAPIYRFNPMDESYPPFFVGCSEKDTSVNLLCRISLESWDEGATCPRGVLVQTFGRAGDLAAEEEALLAHYGAVRWKREDLNLNTLKIPSRDSCIDGTIYNWTTFHIDPPGCRDIDDAITLNYDLRGENSVVLKIHIADVSSWLVSNPVLRLKASKIGQTLYKDGAVVRPMFPVGLSEGLFSLLPGKKRYAWTLSREWREGEGFIGEDEWSLEEIQVEGSYTYETAAAAPWARTLQGIATTLAGRECSDPHEWVEQLMLYYNKAVATILRRIGGNGVLRRHAAPDVARLEQMRALGLPAEQVAMRAGEYCGTEEEDVTHWGLGEAVYCHATSPIRRWADCLNQLALRDRLLLEWEGVVSANASPLPLPALAQKADGERARDCDSVTQCLDISTRSPARRDSSSNVLSSKKDIQALNRAAATAKAYERDLQFLRVLIGPTAQKEVEAVVVEPGRVWVAAWRKLVRTVTGELAPGTTRPMQIFCDPTRRNWKGRLVTSLRET